MQSTYWNRWSVRVRWRVHHNFVRVGRYSERGWACTPLPPSPGWANFSITMECTPESGHCHCVYSVVHPLSHINAFTVYDLQHTLFPFQSKSADHSQHCSENFWTLPETINVSNGLYPPLCFSSLLVGSSYLEKVNICLLAYYDSGERHTGYSDNYQN